MKAALLISLLAGPVLLFPQACGSSNGKKSVRPASEGGAGGEASAGRGGTGDEGGAAGAIGQAGSGGEVTGGSAGESSSPQGGSADEPSPGGAGGQAGASVDGGAGGAGGEAAFACELAPECSGDLSGVGKGDFSIAFTLTTSVTQHSAVISQRAECMRSMFWDIRLGTTTDISSLSIELDDDTNYVDLIAPVTLNDGTPHEVRICRKAGHVYAFSDGTLIGDTPNETSLVSLPPLATKTTTCTSTDGTAPLVGSVTDVCVGAL